ncbi:MAG: FG-GAP repeat domain-containing protein [Verrucomicrobiales bacterium]
MMIRMAAGFGWLIGAVWLLGGPRLAVEAQDGGGVAGEATSKADSQLPPALTDEQRAEKIIAVEEAIQEITPLLSRVAAALITPPPDEAPEWLRIGIPVVGAPLAEAPPWKAAGPVELAEWPSRAGPSSLAVPPWGRVRAMMAEWTAPKFGVLRGVFTQRTTGDLVLDTKFEAAATGVDGLAYGVKATQSLVWRRDGEGAWALVEWRHGTLKLARAAHPFFEEVLDRAVPDAYAREMARRSPQEEITAAALRDERLVLPKPEYVDVADMENAWQYPSVSVVDYDGDGHDDLFLTARWGRGQLLRNRGDGTFEDVTFRAGLDIEHGINCALFADFDNDGDPDLLLGRSIEPTLYLTNDRGRFTDATATLTDLGRQFLVSSMAAADVNRDGLLDVYLSTYSPGLDVRPVWKQRYLRPDEAATLDGLLKTAHPYLDDRGAPNVLLMNRGGGRLERAGGEVVKLWRKSYQPAWADVDGDGDDDLYVCNDFAPDTLLRNDTPRGAAEPVFTDAFREFFPDGSMAFGMGASFGDVDRDGDLDLFVSNMYSKAGNRIIEMAGGADPRIVVSAQGNFLYRNEGGRFTQAAAPDSPEARVGWAFGGQFADFDNDGRLDLYVPSGYYTAPSEVATDVDL